MREFARTMGFLNLVAGVFLVFFPGIARPAMEARAEYARLSDNALRVLGVWVLLMGASLLGVTTGRTADVTLSEVGAARRHVAA